MEPHRTTRRHRFFGPVSIITLLVLNYCAAGESQSTAILDPTEAALIKNVALSYHLENLVFPDSDPCTTWNPQKVKCDCYFADNTGQPNTLCRITRIDFSMAGMEGPFPKDLTKLTYLTSLQLYNNNMTGPIPPEIGLLTRLNSLSLGTNGFSGTIPRELGNLQALQLLHLDSNQLNGTIPSEIGTIQTVRQLWLSDNNLSGPIPDVFGNFTGLLEVRIHGNPLLQGPIPSSLFNSPSIEAIYIGELSEGKALPATFTTPLSNLSVLYLRNCRLTGSIPSTINMLSKLQYLDLSFNNLSGEIPSQLSEITSLKTLYLGSNSLTGRLPEGLGALSFLTEVDVSYNFLNGTLPSWVDKPTVTTILGSNYFSTITAVNSQVQPQLSLLNCQNQKTPCVISALGNVTSLAVNVGGSVHGKYEEDTATLGSTAFAAKKHWAASSTGFVPGASFTSLVKSGTPVSGTADQTVYATARTSLGSLRYYATQLRNGDYNVVLSFAEIVYTRDDNLARRVFDIYLQGQLMKKDFDIGETAGGSFVAHEEKFQVAVTTGVLDIHLFYAGKGTCCLPQPSNWSFGPLLSAISVDNVLSGGQTQVSGGKNSKGSSVGLIVGLTVAAIVLVILVLCCICGLVVRRRKNRTTLRLEDQLEIQKFQVQPNLFSYAELKAATRSFDPGNKLGEGGYGVVYKGVLADGTEVAVKTLSAKSYQGKHEFLNEAALITAVQHRSLVKLKGCCLERDHRILVYEFMENKSLHQTLFGARAMPMDWPTRFIIALGTARGLAYLHEESEARIVHRDIKASNILLDRNFNPKIADFGMARLFEDHQSHVSTRVAGTLGYVAPEYALLGQLTEKADVFSYGIVLLELVSGRFNIRTDIRGEQAYLLEWAWKLEAEDNLLYVMDGKLLDTYVEDEVLRVLHVALLCTQAVASTRPCMTRVVAMLLGDIELPPITSGPGFMVGLMHSETPSHSTSSSFLTNSSGFRGKESAPLIQLSETRTKTDMEMYPR
ncbi:probable LRR receptor-like serine/threonine-protein kinase At1g56140 isoform X2 [Physcomitrium patens]|uniref:Protein kinase domain-containing protein n=1 Tax=Physcomitrium patens TaxID=3218 RepID=A0A2K1IN66_PHYPA|nr:probable LRR receptor-like serine/threonine-protein kinase At1g56140 isoform X2 [Physcomitrium patens]PNR30726.1 hypothetical protein PHYPA_027042 [Physcomitrium patens]|eukprot:XP_024360860.1 probable LRR receptor-like serine/threonine-protein kinase At1g56140 isoform X2 [Physcomitrella patens]